MADKLSWSPEYLEAITVDEIEQALKGDIPADVENRLKSNWTLVLENRKVKLFLEDLSPARVIGNDSVKLIKGQSVFKTNKKIEGIVGKDILVASMTYPDMIVLIKKMKAVITDEGGLLCHAAITAREFKIPTIIGTKIATQILKNGDLVEVDADKGIITILS